MRTPRTKQPEPALLGGHPPPPLEDATTHLQSGNSSLSSCQLPLELIEAILSHLRHRKAALKSCSLVSRNWTHYCRQHLFRQFSLDWTRKLSPRGNSEASQFLALLDHSPIGHFIQILSITSNPLHTTPWAHLDVTSVSFARLLSRLENLKSLNIRSFEIRLDHGKDRLARKISRSRSLDNLVIEDFTIDYPCFNSNEGPAIINYPFLRFLRLFGQIDTLSLGRCYYEGPSFLVADATSSPPLKFKIHTLRLTTGFEMDSSSDCVKDFLECIDLDQLQSLHVVHEHSWNADMTDHIVERSPNLTNVSLHLPVMRGDMFYLSSEYLDEWNWIRSPSFSLPRLGSITIHVRLISSDKGEFNNKWVELTLQSMLEEMEHLDHKFILEISIMLEQGPSAFDRLDWDLLRSSIEELPMLTKLSLRINVPGSGDPQAADLAMYDIPRRELLPLRERCGAELDIP